MISWDTSLRQRGRKVTFKNTEAKSMAEDLDEQLLDPDTFNKEELDLFVI